MPTNIPLSIGMPARRYPIWRPIRNIGRWRATPVATIAEPPQKATTLYQVANSDDLCVIEELTYTAYFAGGPIKVTHFPRKCFYGRSPCCSAISANRYGDRRARFTGCVTFCRLQRRHGCENAQRGFFRENCRPWARRSLQEPRLYWSARGVDGKPPSGWGARLGR